MTALTFDALRAANRARVGQFRNKHGELAHRRPDGSDWSPAQWLQALIGELGEFAQLRMLYEAGEIDDVTYRREAGRELADVQTYLDLLALRAYDVSGPVPDSGHSPAQLLMHLVASLGEYANDRKKADRGDWTPDEFRKLADVSLNDAMQSLLRLELVALTCFGPHPGDATLPQPGVDLGQATVDKFNAVSARIGCEVML